MEVPLLQLLGEYLAPVNAFKPPVALGAVRSMVVALVMLIHCFIISIVCGGAVSSLFWYAFHSFLSRFEISLTRKGDMVALF